MEAEYAAVQAAGVDDELGGSGVVHAAVASSAQPKLPSHAQPALSFQFEAQGTQKSTVKDDALAMYKVMSRDDLKAVVKRFAQETLEGMPLTLVVANSGELLHASLWMDKYFSQVTLNVGNTARASFALQSVTAIYSGTYFKGALANIAHMEKQCVGIDIAGGEQLLFHFMDGNQRARFIACMKILRASFDIKPDTAPGAAELRPDTTSAAAEVEMPAAQLVVAPL